LTSLTSRSQPIAFDLGKTVSEPENIFKKLNKQTLRFRHDLQFIDSRGSLLMRRAGSRSMPTCGLPDMVEKKRPDAKNSDWF
jgi:hypothetical protein